MLVTANIDLDNPTLGDDEHNRQFTALHLSAMQGMLMCVCMCMCARAYMWVCVVVSEH